MTKPIPVRCATQTLKSIDRIAAKLQTSRARLIAFAALSLTQHVEEEKTVAMPPDWTAIFESLDGLKLELSSSPKKTSRRKA